VWLVLEVEKTISRGSRSTNRKESCSKSVCLGTIIQETLASPISRLEVWWKRGIQRLTSGLKEKWLETGWIETNVSQEFFVSWLSWYTGKRLFTSNFKQWPWNAYWLPPSTTVEWNITRLARPFQDIEMRPNMNVAVFWLSYRSNSVRYERNGR
jgi:hypothetical protein